MAIYGQTICIRSGRQDLKFSEKISRWIVKNAEIAEKERIVRAMDIILGILIGKNRKFVW